MSKMGLYQVGRKWLNESVVTETVESQVEKAVAKALGTDEGFLTGETIKDSKIKKLFVGVPALNAGNAVDKALFDKQKKTGERLVDADGNITDPELKKQADAAIKPALGKIFAVTFNPNRGKNKINYDIVVLGNKAQAQKMSKAFLSALTAKLQGVTLGQEKVLKSEDREKSRNELVTISDHPFLEDVWVIESEIPFTLG